MELKELILIFVLVIEFVSSACVSGWGQCGGNNYNGEICCVSGYTCVKINEWYSQCTPGSAGNNNSEKTKTTIKKTTTKVAAEVPTSSATAPKTIFIAGDSTADGSGAHNGKTAGWGKYLGNYVTAKVNNQALSGSSARSFWRDGLWNTLVKGVSRGDYVFIQFGHNDVGGPNAKAEKGSAGGTGDETVTVTRSNGSKEVVHTFPWYIRQMANQVIAKGGTPVLLSYTPNFSFDENGKVYDGSRFQGFMKLVADELKIPFIDHYSYIARQWEKLGKNYLDSNKWFPADYKHTSPVAADFNAKMVINAIKCQKIEGLVAALNNNGKSVNYSCSV